jgi:hypothetical protein
MLQAPSEATSAAVIGKYFMARLPGWIE